jgi:Putative zinc-finger
MTYGHSNEEHPQISQLIPWYVNGTIGELERQKVDAHVHTCALCREELLLERRIYREMTAERGVEYMPAASLKRLQARLDGLDAEAASMDQGAVEPTSRQQPGREQPPRHEMRWQRSMAASIAVLAVAVSLVVANQWKQLRARELSPSYHTVTASETRAPDEVIRAVFSPTITLVELQAILDEAQLRIISGPTEAGVYSLAANSSRPVSSSLALLRGHATVRFAESTQPRSEPSHAIGSGRPP